MAIEKPTRQQLAQVFKNHEILRMVEKLFEQVASDSEQDITQLALDILELQGRMDVAESEIDALQLDAIQVVTKTVDYTVPIGNYLVSTNADSGAITITLPDATTAANYAIGIAKTGNMNTVIIDSNGGLVAGELTQELYYDSEVLSFISDGTNWIVGS